MKQRGLKQSTIDGLAKPTVQAMSSVSPARLPASDRPARKGDSAREKGYASRTDEVDALDRVVELHGGNCTCLARRTYV